MFCIAIDNFVDDKKHLQQLYIPKHYIVINFNKLVNAIHNIQYCHRQLLMAIDVYYMCSF